MKTKLFAEPVKDLTGPFGGLYIEEDTIGAERFFFCGKGLRAVLGVSTFKEIEISNKPFTGSTKISVCGFRFSSKNGHYGACSGHPKIVADFLNRKVREEFSFWAKVVK